MTCTCGREPLGAAGERFIRPRLSSPMFRSPTSVHRGLRNMASHDENPQLALTEGKKAKPGATWKEGETHVLPHNNIPVVFAAFMACTFLAALDQVSPTDRDLNWSRSHLPLDHRRDRVANNRPRPEGRFGIQLGWNARSLFGACK